MDELQLQAGKGTGREGRRRIRELLDDVLGKRDVANGEDELSIAEAQLVEERVDVLVPEALVRLHLLIDLDATLLESRAALLQSRLLTGMKAMLVRYYENELTY